VSRNGKTLNLIPKRNVLIKKTTDLPTAVTVAPPLIFF
jgi:hypothetical protein